VSTGVRASGGPNVWMMDMNSGWTFEFVNPDLRPLVKDFPIMSYLDGSLTAKMFGFNYNIHWDLKKNKFFFG